MGGALDDCDKNGVVDALSLFDEAGSDCRCQVDQLATCKLLNVLRNRHFLRQQYHVESPTKKIVVEF